MAATTTDHAETTFVTVPGGRRAEVAPTLAGPVPQADLWPLFAALGQKPLLVVRGERSDLLTAETARKMQAVAPGMKLAVVAGVGHAPELSEPEAVAAIDAFLDSLG